MSERDWVRDYETENETKIVKLTDVALTLTAVGTEGMYRDSPCAR